ncbi:cation:dicarboxylate symporter family transporter [Massilia endophytica]|uniref:cation:dicarboxylate symporter family transporter n=1 Tax=Massilia endophytica TaxID=2899220 RepID=UPI001E61B0A1|nr:cation:dicarboxylase symporter family transporter [Massilia endophytica]UGQ46188.1 cation:dicarboxylase symporter family transporter [Massilia endophytica]
MRFYRRPFLVLAATVGAGLLFGLADPAAAVQMKPLSDGFVRLLAWLMNPLVFCMLASGAASMARGRKLSRLAASALLYFLFMSLLSLGAGLLAGAVLQPGAGFDADHAQPTSVAGADAAPRGAFGFLLGVPALHVNNLYLLLAAVPAGLLLGRAGARGQPVLAWIERGRSMLFAAVGWLLRLAPLAAFGAMSYTVGRYGTLALMPLLKFIVAINASSILFVVLAMGAVARIVGLPLLRYLRYIRTELYLVFFTSSSLAALAPLSEKLERLGCPRPVTGVVLPFSYSLNLAGTSLYIALALLFLAQAAHVQLGWQDLAMLFGIALLTSKGAVGIAGSGITTLAATVAVLQIVPVDMVALLLGIDRTMKCRALTNVIGHGLACVVCAARERSLDREAMAATLGQC